MFGKRPQSQPAIEAAQPRPEEKSCFESAMHWEASITQAREASERRAWHVAAAAVAMTVLSWGGIALMLPLKESIPYVIRVDSVTGVPDIITVLDTKSITADDVSNKYWLAQYVRARETYDWHTLQKDYDTVGMLSSNSIGRAYANLFTGKDALDKRYGADTRATIDILSVVPAGTSGVGTVRFIKTTKRVNDDGPGVSTKWIATIGFEYRNPSAISESQRLVNPFGFQVLSYRVDPELVGEKS